MSTIRLVLAALLIAGPAVAQETTNNPFPDPIPASEGVIVVGKDSRNMLADGRDHILGRHLAAQAPKVFDDLHR